MKIAIVVHGRFYAFDLMRALLARGHDVTLFTNYPRWVVRRFDLPVERVRSYWIHGVVSKAWNILDPDNRFSGERWLHPMFGAWARDRLLEEGPWDAIHAFSGVAEEILRVEELAARCQLVRASAHIRVQARLLDEESRRVGTRLDHPSPWMIQRELREYERARTIMVLSTFAHRSFLDEGVPENKLRLMPLGADLEGFKPSPEAVEERIRRIRRGDPLTVVYAGSISYQKGMFDFARIIERLSGEGFRFRLAGAVMPECRRAVKSLRGKAVFLGKVPQETLPEVYAQGDVFVFPTIQDGYAVVLAQALVSGLPVLSTGNCSALELVQEDRGWVLPARSPELFIERLRWCDAHREELAAIVESLYREQKTRGYDAVAEDFERISAGNAEAAAGTPPAAPLKVAIVVHGRFHAFDLSRALVARGMDVTVFTSYPWWIAEQWGIPRQRLRTFPLHGVLARAGGWMRERMSISTDALLHPLFARWAVRQLKGQPWDVIYSFSGVSEDIGREPSLAGALRIVVRGSAHIRTQQRLLREEEERTGQKLDLPGKWMVEREEREYRLADRIVVLSSFAWESFRAEGVPVEKTRILPLGTETSAFRPGLDAIEARRGRILSGAPLRVLFVGGVGWNKGLADLRDLVQATARSGRFRFRFVGPILASAAPVVASLSGLAEFPGKRPQRELAQEYLWADLFIFPTIQDGYAVVLAQASAGGLPILTTTNCCGPDLIREGKTGWVLPIRDTEAFLERLQWCDTHRQDLAEMVTAAYTEFRTRDWMDVAADLETMCRAEIAARDHGKPVSEAAGEQVGAGEKNR
ncbi:MAG TPA: glycosyltransferase family 4 protein [Bryobacteraceae bacterium]|nr:glycosyltransferase family 4 protein [Bryobacteraceae bacterium]